MAQQWYIHEAKYEFNGVIEKLVESAYYGPFPENELIVRINDSYADALAVDGTDILVARLSDEIVAKLYINSREFWMSQLASLTEQEQNA